MKIAPLLPLLAALGCQSDKEIAITYASVSARGKTIDRPITTDDNLFMYAEAYFPTWYFETLEENENYDGPIKAEEYNQRILPPIKVEINCSNGYEETEYLTFNGPVGDNVFAYKHTFLDAYDIGERDCEALFETICREDNDCMGNSRYIDSDEEVDDRNALRDSLVDFSIIAPCDDETDMHIAYLDADGDGYGDPDKIISECPMPSGYVKNNDDCDDGNVAVNPDAEEVCNDGLDNDCDNEADCSLFREADLGDYQSKVSGEESDDSFGACVASADIDGDGLDNIIVGAPGNSSSEHKAGATYVFSDLAEADAILTGEESGDYSGNSIAAGDVDGDGLVDLVIGSRYHDDRSGAAYVLFSPTQGSLSLVHADAKFLGEEVDDEAATAIALGDVDDDGFADLLIGAPYHGEDNTGKAYLIHGPDSGDVSLENADVTFSGSTEQDWAGRAVASGDFDDNGFADLLIAAPGDDTAGDDVGMISLFYGPASGENSLDDADVQLYGEYVGYYAGMRVADGGDVNSDGYPDVLVSSYFHPGEYHRGMVYVVNGPVNGDLDLEDADARIMGLETGDEAGYSIASAGDVNNDDIGDIVIGARLAQEYSGEVYVVHGPMSGSFSLSVAFNKFTGAEVEDEAGYSVAGVGDLDADNFDDIVIGAPGANSFYFIPLGGY